MVHLLDGGENVGLLLEHERDHHQLSQLIQGRYTSSSHQG